MSKLSELSTLEDIRRELLRTASYESAGDAALARDFITACRALSAAAPSSSSEDARSLAIDKAHYREEMRAAQAWLARHGGAATPSGFSGAGGGARVRVPEAWR